MSLINYEEIFEDIYEEILEDIYEEMTISDETISNVFSIELIAVGLFVLFLLYGIIAYINYLRIDNAPSFYTYEQNYTYTRHIRTELEFLDDTNYNYDQDINNDDTHGDLPYKFE